MSDKSGGVRTFPTRAPQSQSNLSIAAKLRDYAYLLSLQNANAFRIRAYTEAARIVEGMARPVAEVLHEGGLGALIAMPAVGRSIASAIAEMVASGRWRQLDRLRGELTPERLFRTVPGMGPVIARRLVDEHDCETLEDVERVLSDSGRSVAGIGSRRRAALLSALREQLSRMPRFHAIRDEPDIVALLDVDRRYREEAKAGILPHIAPKRFNPQRKAWLPILHTDLDGWHYTALFSNTALAHKLDRTKDWVVLIFQRDDGAESQRTVVTETRGPMSGRRVVRGREQECHQYHARHLDAEPASAE